MTAEQAQRAQLNLKRSPERKERWEGAVDADPRYSSLSHLVRVAIERELASECGYARGTSEVGVDAEAVEAVEAVRGTAEAASVNDRS